MSYMGVPTVAARPSFSLILTCTPRPRQLLVIPGNRNPVTMGPTRVTAATTFFMQMMSSVTSAFLSHDFLQSLR